MKIKQEQGEQNEAKNEALKKRQNSKNPQAVDLKTHLISGKNFFLHKYLLQKFVSTRVRK